LASLYVALIHHPVYDKRGQVVTTSITTIDLHDIARSCRTYGVPAFYVVSPVDALRGLMRRVLRHWQEGYGSTYNPNRREALDLIQLQRTLEGVEIDIEARTGRLPKTIATSARESADTTGFAALREEIASSEEPWLLLLGTGWGLTAEVLSEAERRLVPITGVGAYNHLSVRAAASIILDRLLGTR
jgi:hypothetical protein